MTTWPLSLTSTLTTRTLECECALSCFFSFVSTVSHLAHSPWLKSWVLCLSSISSTCAHEVSDSLRPCSPLLPQALPVALLPLLPALEVRRQPAAHSAQREYGLVWRVLPLHRLWAQRLRLQGDFGRALHRAPGLTAVLLQQRVSRGRRTLHSRVCFVKLTECIAITLNETCLSVCRRQCPTERGDLLGTERGVLLSEVARKHRLGLCSTNKKRKFLPSARQELTETNFKPLTTEEVY